MIKFNLGWKLSLAQKGYASGILLDSYEVERIPVISEMLQITTDIYKKQIQDVKHLEQMDILKASRGGWDIFPDALHETIRLRLDDPTASLSELAARLDPPISKPGLNHRMRRIVSLARAAAEEEPT